MKRGVRIPSLRGCGKKEAFSRMKADQDRDKIENPQAVDDFSNSPGAMAQDYMDLSSTANRNPQAANDFSSSPGV
jgi:hypothetical protein